MESSLQPFEKQNVCLSCGKPYDKKKRRYCSIECRRKLRQKLNMRTGLLKVLNARYATFYFTDTMIILDILPYGQRQLFSFIYPRRHLKQPADDFSQMANLLGNLWWGEKKRTNKSYLASLQVLKQANKNGKTAGTIKPVEHKIPTIKGASVLHLKLSKEDLNTEEYIRIIKATYRRQAKKHHPDMGGDSATFRKIHKAYEDLLTWAENPTFLKRRGFPDKWFYDADQNRWVQPIPEVKEPVT